MTALTALQAPSSKPLRGSVASSLRDSPSIELAGVKVFAARDGDRVTGRVEFPYPAYGRASVPIDYRNAQPDPSPARRQADFTVAFRVAVLQKWRDLCAADPAATKRETARRAIAETRAKCSPRTLYLWARKLDAQGPQGLRDRYQPAPRAVLALDHDVAREAVLVCAWWAFRIGNLDLIDSKAVHAAASLLHSSVPPCLRASVPVSDILAAIDCCYSWPCDRARYPFKSFQRWAKYDFEPWLFRACDREDYRRRACRPEPQPAPPAPLRQPQTVRDGDAPDPRDRARDAADPSTRAAIAGLSEPGAQATGSPLADWLQSQDPRWRRLFMDLARAPGKQQREARLELVATAALWWPNLPRTVREAIDVRLKEWQSRNRPTEAALADRRVLALVPHLRDARAHLPPGGPR